MSQKALDEFSIDFVTKGSKQVMRDMQGIITKLQEMQQVTEGNTSLLDKDTQKQKQNTEAHEKNTKAITKQNSALWTYAKRLVGVYGIYKLVQKGIGMAINFAEKGNAYANMASISGVSTGNLQKWGYALRRFGGNEQTAANTLGTLNQKLFAMKQYGEQPFEEYISKFGGRITSANNAEELLKMVARDMQGRSNIEKVAMGQSLGLDQATINFLMQGADVVEKALRSAEALFSPEDIKAAQEAKENLEEFNRELEKLGITISRTLLPGFTEFVKELTEFIKDPGGYIYDRTHPETEVLVAPEKEEGSVMGRGIRRAKSQIFGLGDIFESDKNRGAVLYDEEEERILNRGGKVGYALSKAARFLSSLPSIATMSGMSSSISNLFNQDNSITINGAASPEKTGSEVVRQISNWSGESVFNNVMNNFTGRND